MLLNVPPDSLKPKLISFWKHHPIADQRAETLAKSTLEFQQKFKCYFIKITPAGSWQAVCHGVEDTWNGDSLGRRIITKTIIHTPQDWLSLPDFSETQPPLMHEIIGACKIVKEKTTDNTSVFSTVFCPVSQAIQMAGLPLFLQHVQTRPQEVLAGLERITQNTLYIIDKLIKAGSKGVYFVTQHMRNGALTPELYKAFGEPFDEKCLNACKDLLFNIFHIHGSSIYFSLGNIPPNCFIHYEHDIETIITDEWQNKFSSRLLCGMPASEMAQCHNGDEIKQLIQQKVKGAIITAGCVLPLDFPDESTLNWMTVSKSIM